MSANPLNRFFQLIQNLVISRKDSYLKYWQKENKSGYSPAFVFDWKEYAKFKNRGGHFKDFKGKQFEPLEEAIIEKHLQNRRDTDKVAIYPISYTFETKFINIRLPRTEARRFYLMCQKIGLKSFLEIIPDRVNTDSDSSNQPIESKIDISENGKVLKNSANEKHEIGSKSKKTTKKSKKTNIEGNFEEDIEENINSQESSKNGSLASASVPIKANTSQSNLSQSQTEDYVWIFFKNRQKWNKIRDLFVYLIKKSLNLSDFYREENLDFRFFDGYFGLDTYTHLPGIDFWENLEVAFESGQALVLDQDMENIWQKIMDSKTAKKLAHRDSIKIVLKNYIILNHGSLNDKLETFLKDKLNILNTEFSSRQKLGISTFGLEMYFNLIEESGDFIYLPIGFWDILVAFLEKEKMDYQVEDLRHKKNVSDQDFNQKFDCQIQLFEYQVKALQKIDKENMGVLEAPPGSGKTVMALETFLRKKQRTLIIVHRGSLLEQWIERITSFLKIDKSEIGIIGSGKKSVGEWITIGMQQTLSNIQDLESEFGIQEDGFGMVIVDECHHIPARTFRKVITQLSPFYLYGLSATPIRKHSDEALIFMYLGQVIARVNPHKEKDIVMQVKVIETNLMIPFFPENDKLEMLNKILIYDSQRNYKITQDVFREHQNGRKILIITERREHIDILKSYLPNQSMEIVTLSGEDSSQSRNQKIKQIQDLNFDVLITTGQLFGEGMDFPHFDCLFLVYPFSFEGKLIQYIGRIQRSNGLKTIIDYRDKKVAFFDSMFKKRLSYYKDKIGFGEKLLE